MQGLLPQAVPAHTRNRMSARHATMVLGWEAQASPAATLGIVQEPCATQCGPLRDAVGSRPPVVCPSDSTLAATDAELTSLAAATGDPWSNLVDHYTPLLVLLLIAYLLTLYINKSFNLF